ncbi:response regulator [Telmatospirillum siberiense]|uniref:Response regulator n=1 Tax=Telmatospirillum siberiense TaxID=382514 RepID=A0A2N3PR79_9PROT|nr:response regulator [Telmatospirillum siberiense]PKU22901.1 response regulator [Telmatospirillum siberiense]
MGPLRQYGEELDILLVEDNPGDARLATEAWKEGGVPGRLHIVADGDEAIRYLRRPEAGRPDLLLLDLNLPCKDGREVLAEIKGDPELRRIPVVVLTTSQADPDVIRSYDLHANCFVAKPVDLDSFIAVIKSIAEFWGRVVLLPPR